MNIIIALSLPLPPEFPIVMSMGILFSLRRLRLRHIYCIDSSKINVAGRISIMVFDKTGTLTEEGLTCHSSKIKRGHHFERKIKSGEEIRVPEGVYFEQSEYMKHREDTFLKYVEWMAAWHQVTVLDDGMFGDPLDVEMLKTCKWKQIDSSWKDDEDEIVETFVYPPEVVERMGFGDKLIENYHRLKIEYKFDFSSALQRMSVIVSNKFDTENQYTMYIKGSPEIIKELWVRSTYPKDYDKTFNKYTKKGLRVIALAYKHLQNFDISKADDIEREDIECDESFTFLGFLIFSNKLKPATKNSIKELNDGKQHFKL